MDQYDSLPSCHASPTRSAHTFEVGSHIRSKRNSHGSIASSSSSAQHRVLSPDDFKRTKSHLVLDPRTRSRGAIMDSPDIKRLTLPSPPTLQTKPEMEPQEPQGHEDDAEASSSMGHMATVDSLASKATFGPRPVPLLPRLLSPSPPPPLASPTRSDYTEEADQREELDTIRDASCDWSVRGPLEEVAIQRTSRPTRPRTASSENLKQEAAQAWASYLSRIRPSKAESIAQRRQARAQGSIPSRISSLQRTSLVLAAMPRGGASPRTPAVRSAGLLEGGSRLASQQRSCFSDGSHSIEPPTSSSSLESPASPNMSTDSCQVPLLRQISANSDKKPGARGGGLGGEGAHNPAHRLSKARQRSIVSALPRLSTRNDLTADQRRDQVRRMKKLAYLLGEESLQAVCADLYIGSEAGRVERIDPVAAKSGRRPAQFPLLRRRGSFDSNSSPVRLRGTIGQLRRPATASALPSCTAFDVEGVAQASTDVQIGERSPGRAALKLGSKMASTLLQSDAHPGHSAETTRFKWRPGRSWHVSIPQDAVFLISDPNHVEDFLSPKAASVLGIQHPFSAHHPDNAGSARAKAGNAEADSISLASVEVADAYQGNEGAEEAGENEDEDMTPQMTAIESGSFVLVDVHLHRTRSFDTDASRRTDLADERDSHSATLRNDQALTREWRRRKVHKMSRWLGETVPAELVAPGASGLTHHLHADEQAFEQRVAAAQVAKHMASEGCDEGRIRYAESLASRDQQAAHLRRLNKLDKIFGASVPAGLVSAPQSDASRAIKSPSILTEVSPATPASSVSGRSEASTATFISSSRHVIKSKNHLEPEAPLAGADRKRPQRQRSFAEGRSFISIDSSDSESSGDETAAEGNEGTNVADGNLGLSRRAMDSLLSLAHSGESEADASLASEDHGTDKDGRGDRGPGQQISRPEVVIHCQDSPLDGFIESFGDVSIRSKSETGTLLAERRAISLGAAAGRRSAAALATCPMGSDDTHYSHTTTLCDLSSIGHERDVATSCRTGSTRSSRRVSRAFLSLDSDSEEEDGDRLPSASREQSASLDRRSISASKHNGLSEADRTTMRHNRLSRFFGQAPPPPAPPVLPLPPLPTALSTPSDRPGRPSIYNEPRRQIPAPPMLRSLEEETLEETRLAAQQKPTRSRPAMLLTGARWRH